MKSLINKEVYEAFDVRVGIAKDVDGKRGTEIVLGLDSQNRAMTLSSYNAAIVKRVELGDYFHEGAYNSNNLYKRSKSAYNLVEYDDLSEKANKEYQKAAKIILYLNTICNNDFLSKAFITKHIDLDDAYEVDKLVSEYVDMLWEETH